MNGFGEFFCKSQVRLAGFTPDQVGVRGVSQTTRDCLISAWTRLEEAFNRTLAGQEGLVVVVDVRGQQICCFCIGTRQQNGGCAGDVCGQASRVEFFNGFTGRHQYFATHVTAFFYRSQLVFEVNASGARVDHGFHQLIGVEHATETGFSVSHDGREEVDIVFAFGPLNLVGTH